MEPFLMLRVSAYLFGATALGGVLMGIIRFSSGSNPPSWLAMLHGFLAAAAITLLAYAVIAMDVPQYATLSLILFLVGAAGGIVLNLGYHMRDIAVPKWLVGVHATIASVALVLLYIAAFTQS